MIWRTSKPNEDVIVAQLVETWQSRYELLYLADAPYEHYHDESGEEVPFSAIAKWASLRDETAEDAHKIEGIKGNLEEIPSIDKDQLARSAASEWCRCFKCDGIVNETQLPCWKPGATCLKWYDAYKAVRIALDKVKKVKVAPGVEVKITETEDEQNEEA